MGMARDMKQRLTLARTDDARRCSRIRAAQEAVYLNNYAINSKAVEKLLQEHSLVPAKVRSCFLFLSANCHLLNRVTLECVFHQADAIRF